MNYYNFLLHFSGGLCILRVLDFYLCFSDGPVAELVDACDLKSQAFGRTGSSPVGATITLKGIKYQ